MFPPCVVPGQGEDPAAEVLLAEIAAWVRSEPLRALVERFGDGTPSGELADELDYLDDFTAENWNFRKTDAEDPMERNEIDEDAIQGADEEFAIAAADALGLVRPRPPKYPRYDHLVVLGGLVRANLWRPEFAAHLLRQGVHADNIVGITAYRDLRANEKKPDRDEFNLLQHFGLPRREYEWQVMEDGLRRAFSLPEFTVALESSPDAGGGARFRVAKAESGGRAVSLVVAPAIDGGPRATTADGYRYWAEQVGHVKPGDRVLAVTTCIYVPYQHAVAIQLLGLPFGCSIDTVGIDFGVVDDSPAPQEFRGAHYLLEVRSALRAYRQLAKKLQDEAGQPGGAHGG